MLFSGIQSVIVKVWYPHEMLNNGRILDCISDNMHHHGISAASSLALPSALAMHTAGHRLHHWQCCQIVTLCRIQMQSNIICRSTLAEQGIAGRSAATYPAWAPGMPYVSYTDCFRYNPKNFVQGNNMSSMCQDVHKDSMFVSCCRPAICKRRTTLLCWSRPVSSILLASS